MKKVLATVLLAPPTVAIVGFCWSFGIDVKASIERSIRNELNIESVEKEVREIHWYLIKKNDVQVPPSIHKGE